MVRRTDAGNKEATEAPEGAYSLILTRSMPQIPSLSLFMLHAFIPSFHFWAGAQLVISIL